MKTIFFLKKFFKDHHKVGSLIPSSKKLAEVLSSSLRESDKFILEIGGGTGSVMTALDEKRNNNQRISVVELDSDFARVLQSLSKVDRVEIIQGDFLRLSFLSKYDYVICSLPLSNFSQETNDLVAEKIVKVTNVGALVVFFEYIGFEKRLDKMRNSGLVYQRSLRVLGNFPPARVNIFKRV